VFENIKRDPTVVGICAIENTIAGSLLHNYELLRQKAMEDSIRMAKTAEAVKLAENSDEESANAEKAKQAEAKAKAEAKKRLKIKPKKRLLRK
jgi:hypothetical protein